MGPRTLALARFSIVTSALVAVSTPVSAVEFLRGDADAGGTHGLSDAVRIFGVLFLGGEPTGCDDASDANDSGVVDIADGVWVLNFLFLGGPEPPVPFATCGEDPSADGLGCERFEPCAAEPVPGTLFFPFHDGFECVRAPCPNWSAFTPEADEPDITGVDVSALDLEPPEEDALLDELRAGRHVVRGFVEETPALGGPAVDRPVADGAAAGSEVFRTLIVHELADEVGERWHIFANGIVCITWPCPSFTAENGRTSMHVSGFDVRPLGLDAREEEAVTSEIARGGWIVRGLLVRGPTGPAGEGTTIVVLELVERTDGRADE